MYSGRRRPLWNFYAPSHPPGSFLPRQKPARFNIDWKEARRPKGGITLRYPQGKKPALHCASEEGRASPAPTNSQPLQAADWLCVRHAGGLICGLFEPGFETRLAEPRAIAGNERILADLHSVVTPLRVGDDFARILECGQSLPGKFIEGKLFRPPDFNHAICR